MPLKTKQKNTKIFWLAPKITSNILSDHALKVHC
uniref:Uncharacterized protein n=1 Tax=Lepeophtheirus salmonis TaxID=72036 RepID=A0A0K2TZA5_LEPSM